jgi:hypothetical protein
MPKLLPSPKAKQHAIHKVLAKTSNKHSATPVKYKNKKKADRKAGLIK